MSALDRSASLQVLAEREFDVVVIGAGMTGAGAALDASSRGYSVALIDAGDIACGTSSKSSKMVHGGLRYLQQREFRLVYENLRERQRLLNNAPHLVRVLPFLIPLFGKDGAVSRTVSRAYSGALRLYDLTGGWRIGRRYERVTRNQALAHVPSLRVDRLVAGFLYFDARGDDARVALTLAKTAATHGAVVATYVRVLALNADSSGRVRTVSARDEHSGTPVTIRARSVINATGVWASEVAQLSPTHLAAPITPAKGVHVTVRADRLRADVAAVIPVPKDRRSIFVVPFEEGGFTYIGTTDTAYNGSLDDPLCTAEDVDYLLNAVNTSTSAALTQADITGVWAGLRPLLAPTDGGELAERTADLSRRHRVSTGDDGVVHVTGGKWTTYREMAEDAVDAVGKVLHERRKCRTESLRLDGYGAAPAKVSAHLAGRYGTRAADVAALMDADPSLGELAIEGLPYLRAEFLYAAREEMVVTLIDLLTRRTRAHLMDARATLAAADSVSMLVASVLGWDEPRRVSEVESYRALVEHELSAAGLTVESTPQ